MYRVDPRHYVGNSRIQLGLFGSGCGNLYKNDLIGSECCRCTVIGTYLFTHLRVFVEEKLVS